MNFSQRYYQEPYSTEFDAEVISCVPYTDPAGGSPDPAWAAVLSDTLFYAEGGGQSADRGFLQTAAADGSPSPGSSRITVSHVYEENDIIYHVLPEPVEPGSTVHGVIDWAFRFPLMQGHTGEHIISGIAHRRFGCENVGFHMGDGFITLDLNKPLTPEDIRSIETEANRVITQNLPVSVLYPSDDELDQIDYRSKKELSGTVRIIHIPDADDCACCGLHVRTTGEVGLVKIISYMNYKGGVRLTMLTGMEAFLDYCSRLDELQAVCRLLSAEPDGAAEAVSRVLEESREKDRRIAAINQSYFSMKAETLPFSDSVHVLFEEDLNQIELRKFCDLLIRQKKAPVCAVLCRMQEDAFSYCIGSSDPEHYDLRKASKQLNEALSGRGGGKPQMISGTFRTGREEIESVLREFPWREPII